MSSDITFYAQYADVGIFVDKTLDAANDARICEPQSLACQQIFTLIHRIISRSVVRSIHHAKSVLSASARKFQCEVRIDDRTRVDEV